VLINWENEILLGGNELSKDKFEIVVPPTSILAEPAVTLVDKVVDKKGTRAAAQAYLEYLYSEDGQDIAAKHYYRTRSASVAAKYADQFPQVSLFTLNEIVDDWHKANKVHFADGGLFDQISQDIARSKQ
jgi:sulfate transport system substrate-binding protein